MCNLFDQNQSEVEVRDQGRVLAQQAGRGVSELR